MMAFRYINFQSFRGANCDTHHYLVVIVVRQRLSVSKQPAQKFDMERFNLKKLNDDDVKEQYQVKISNRFAGLENLDGGGGDDDVDFRGLGKV
jgi:hypothetical protein